MHVSCLARCPQLGLSGPFSSAQMLLLGSAPGCPQLRTRDGSCSPGTQIPPGLLPQVGFCQECKAVRPSRSSPMPTVPQLDILCLDGAAGTPSGRWTAMLIKAPQLHLLPPGQVPSPSTGLQGGDGKDLLQARKSLLSPTARPQWAATMQASLCCCQAPT